MESKKFEGNSILIGIPNHFELPQRFKENLEYLGFKVFVLKSTHQKSIPLKHRVIHGFKKFFLKDKTHKPNIKNQLIENEQIQYIQKCNSVDYALFVRPDLFSFKVVERAKSISKKIVAYQWDGMCRYPLAIKYVDLFDKFYIFDKRDVDINPSFIPTTNFYFDDLVVNSENIQKGQVFFIGTYMKNREKILDSIISSLIENGLVPSFHLFNKKRQRKLGNHIQIILKPFSFKENILKIQRAEFVSDLHNPAHDGLSFRTFESIGYEKKLITNNPLVKEYDFYNPNNIYLIEDTNFNGFKEFVNTPYQKLDDEIMKKYSFTSWIDNLLS